MKKPIWIVIVLIMVLAISACKDKKKDDTLPVGEEGESQVTLFAPLPSFKAVFTALDQLESRDISAAIPTDMYKTKQDPYRNSFALGVLTADAIIAVRGRNKSKLMTIANEMKRITTLLNLEAEVPQLNDDIKTLVEKEQWSELEQTLDKHKKVVEDKLWEREDLDQYTLMVLGGWTEAANRVSWLINRNFTAERTKVLKQKGTWNDIYSNMKLINSASIVNEAYYKPVLELIEKVKAVLDAEIEGTYSLTQTEEILKQTDLIKAEFQK
ncbi:MAG: hypothetical protein FJ042_03360 [Candidatus Cloacimonetes bacterium]|nr:hypothetical protein [Candidatus Cloacimonadota bacterium]